MNYEILTTDTFDKWREKLRDHNALRAIATRILRARNGNLGDVQAVGNNVNEMRIFVGKGYRLYFTIQGKNMVILLCGGNKSTQRKDIIKAHQILDELGE